MKQLELFPPASERQARAVISECQRYRYELYWPTGLENDRTALGIFANPSTATAERTDHTVDKWISYCKRWGYGWAAVGNVRAWRETVPALVPPDPLAIGPENDAHLCKLIESADYVICGWGKLGFDRQPQMLALLRELRVNTYAFRLNRDGSPAHPARLPFSVVPVAFTSSFP